MGITANMNQDNSLKSKVVQTYAEDMARALEDDKSGVIKKIIHGEEEHEKEKRNLSPESKRNRSFLLVGLVCIALGLTTLFYLLQGKDVPTVPAVEAEKKYTAPIFLDQNVSLEVKDLKKDPLAEAVASAVRNTKVKQGGVEGIYLAEDKKIIGLGRFLALIKSGFAPDSGAAKVSFVQDDFLMGVVKKEKGDFFILLKVRSTADVFDSLRAWEGKMFSDLHGFFGISISSQNKYLLTKEFEDAIVGNENARILYYDEGQIALMYIFADDNSVIITSTENAAEEIMSRLASSRVRK